MNNKTVKFNSEVGTFNILSRQRRISQKCSCFTKIEQRQRSVHEQTRWFFNIHVEHIIIADRLEEKISLDGNDQQEIH